MFVWNASVAYTARPPSQARRHFTFSIGRRYSHTAPAIEIRPGSGFSVAIATKREIDGANRSDRERHELFWPNRTA